MPEEDMNVTNDDNDINDVTDNVTDTDELNTDLKEEGDEETAEEEESKN